MQNCCRLSCHEHFPHTRSLAGRVQQRRRYGKTLRGNLNIAGNIGAVDGKHVAIMPPPGSVSRELSLEKNMRYVLVVDDAFLLREYIMEPFSRKVATPARKINYRVFAIIVERFGVLQKPISLIDFTKVHHIVMAYCSLHNFLLSKVPHQYIPLECLDEEKFESGNVTPGTHCNESMSLSKTACHPTNSAELVRELFVE
ncbi:hypothetical protein PR048_021460 [Dryococelus australis]|uniref:DDE Tnp4 domain-containing protein n=1 Tax=Dryococelus australis TaxID=614101 RepID=A0ABQ9GYA9_9NEOP|nr:hypothetical protein PR048_021460 [Dryococelus australis]